jgi:poly-beta-1,6-N-acetyl-D-glucosamine synthase
LSLFLASASLAATTSSPVLALLVVLQLVGYATPLISSTLPSIGRWRPIRIANAFVLLNWYAVLGLGQFLSSHNSHLWQTRSPPARDTP